MRIEATCTAGRYAIDSTITNPCLTRTLAAAGAR
jgi:hypothetical protein